MYDEVEIDFVLAFDIHFSAYIGTVDLWYLETNRQLKQLQEVPMEA